MKHYREIARRLYALESQAFPDVERMTDAELEAYSARGPALDPAELAAIQRMTDAELDALMCMTDAEVHAFVALKVQESEL